VTLHPKPRRRHHCTDSRPPVRSLRTGPRSFCARLEIRRPLSTFRPIHDLATDHSPQPRFERSPLPEPSRYGFHEPEPEDESAPRDFATTRASHLQPLSKKPNYKRPSTAPCSPCPRLDALPSTYAGLRDLLTKKSQQSSKPQVPSVKSLLFRARTQLREALQEFLAVIRRARITPYFYRSPAQ